LLTRTDAVLLEVVARELAAMAASDSSSRGGPLGMAAQLLRTIDTGGVVAAPAPDRGVDVARLQSYLAKRGVIEADATLSPRRSALGFSKDTYLIDVTTPGTASSVVVVRRDLPAGPSRTTVRDEFPLLKSLYAAGMPVAEPLLLEPDASVLGRSFLLTRGAAGEPDVTAAETDQAKRRQAAKDLAGFLAQLHSLPAEKVAIRRVAPGGSPRGELAAYFREWRGFWEETGPEHFRAIPAALKIMEAELPQLERLAVVHSDVGFHNILVENGNITAVLDWEFSHLGEPEEDLSYARPTIEQLCPWDDFVAMYAAAGGPAISPARLKAYQIWRGVRNATCCALGLRAFESGLNADMRLAFTGRVLLRSFVEDVEQQLEKA